MGFLNSGTREMLAALRRPDRLERLPLAVRLKTALGAATAHEAVIHVVDRTFRIRTPSNDLMRAAVFSCDLEGNKALYVASTLNVSIRTFYRRRSDAVAAVAAVVKQIVHRAPPRSYLPE